MRTTMFVLLGSFLAMANAHAQVGPAPARMISRPMPSKAPAAATFNAEAELRITAKGTVDSVTILSGSGDDAFDKQWRKSLSDWRFVPAVDAGGQPVESVHIVTYTNTSLRERPADMNEAPVRNAATETTRFESLTCQDFAWEYGILSDALGRRSALRDPLLKAPLTLLAAGGASADDVQRLNERFESLVTDVVRQCRDLPAEPVWTAVFQPRLLEALAN